jgi:hypothetical protein
MGFLSIGCFYQKSTVNWSVSMQPMLCAEHLCPDSEEHALLSLLPKSSSLKDATLFESACRASILSMVIFLRFLFKIDAE